MNIKRMGSALILAYAITISVGCSTNNKTVTDPGQQVKDTAVNTFDTVKDTKSDVSDTGKDIAADIYDTKDSLDTSSPIKIKAFHGCTGQVDLSSVPPSNFIVAPYLIRPRPDRITIKWEAMNKEPAYLLWGLGGQITDCTCVSDPKRIPIDSTDVTTPDDGWLYSVTLTGLKTDTSYDYTLANARVPKAEPKDSMTRRPEWVPFGTAHFTTAPGPGKPFTLVVYGDNQPFGLELKPAIDQIIKLGSDMVLHVGDIVHNGSVDEYRYNYFLTGSPLLRNIPHLYVAGNHEGHGQILPFDSFFPVPNQDPVTVDGKKILPGPRTGYFDYGNARFFLLDSENPMGEGSNQFVWLNAMLKKTVKEHPEITWLFASWHRPTFTEGNRVFIEPRVAIQNLMKRWKVDAVWNGHNHLYEHFLQDGVVYIVTGGGGALLNGDVNGGTTYPDDNRLAAESSFHIVRGNVGLTEATFQAIRTTDSRYGKAGSIIDTFTIHAKDRSDLK